MSLLMDALRRAEEEKKQAAKEKDQQTPTTNGAATGDVEVQQHVDQDVKIEATGNGAEEELGATVKLDRLPLPIAAKKSSSSDDEEVQQLESLNDLNVDFEKTSPRMKRLAEAESGAEDGSETYTFSVDDEAADAQGNGQTSGQEDAGTGDFSINAEYATEKFTAPLTLEPMQGEDDAVAGANAAVEEKSRPAQKAASDGKDSTLVSSATDPLLALNASESTLETSSGQTAVAANTVFEAGSSGISKRVILWTLALGVAIIGVLIVSGVYYFQQTPTMRTIPAPVASVDLDQNIKLLGTAPDPLSARQSIVSSEPVVTGEPQVPPVESLTTSRRAVADKTPPAGEATARAISASPEIPLATTGEPEQPRAVKELPTATSISDSQRADDEPEQAAQVPTVNTKRLSIAKSLRAKQSGDKVAQAYAAYQSGDLATAKTVYQQALEIRPQDINALNGLGALALHDGDKETAHRFYSRVLKLDPNNATAATAIFQIEGGVGNRVTEAQLKLMLDEGGDPGTINFALGALYARHERWNDAQLAYFEAVRHRPNNPDYLYNLAVSLDQIGQRKAALTYYQKALAAADDASGGFNESQVLSRIQAISSQRPAKPAP